MIEIIEARKEDYEELLGIWERSVSATHAFLTEKDINDLKPIVIDHGFPNVNLVYLKEGTKKIGFIGALDNKVEMLFLEPNIMGKGYGKKLIIYAIKNWYIKYVDVNEQNPNACEFYKHMGFDIIGRSEIDEQGNPFPILHLELLK